MLSKEEGGSKGKKQRKVAGDQGVQRDCVRVKARRGQATDSHSLAERARRAKISMRMKLLQSLVPGCDQITGKAQILDEIIKYVQLLQNQVECLAAKLAFVDLVLYDCKLNPSKNLCASDQGLCCLEPPLPSVPESIYIFRSSADAATTSPSLLITEDQNASLIPQPQDDGNLYFENIGEQHAGLDN